MRPLRSLRVIPVVLVVGLLSASLAPGAAVADEHKVNTGPDFRVGAAAVDITPPLASTGTPNPAACTAPAGYDGAHLLSLEEPYQDTNGNGRFDEGEPFQDCSVPHTDGTVAAPDGRWDGIYLGGGNCCDRKPTQVLDPVWARTIVVSGRPVTSSPS